MNAVPEHGPFLPSFSLKYGRMVMEPTEHIAHVVKESRGFLDMTCRDKLLQAEHQIVIRHTAGEDRAVIERRTFPATTTLVAVENHRNDLPIASILLPPHLVTLILDRSSIISFEGFEPPATLRHLSIAATVCYGAGLDLADVLAHLPSTLEVLDISRNIFNMGGAFPVGLRVLHANAVFAYDPPYLLPSITPLHALEELAVQTNYSPSRPRDETDVCRLDPSDLPRLPLLKVLLVDCDVFSQHIQPLGHSALRDINIHGRNGIHAMAPGMLPSGLEAFSFDSYSFSHFEPGVLPQGLLRLAMNRHHLTSLEGIPDSVQELGLTHSCMLRDCRRLALPRRLQKLDISEAGFRSLACFDPFPSSLVHLVADENHFRVFEERWVEHTALHTLSLSESNSLLEIEPLPATLRTLVVSSIELKLLPSLEGVETLALCDCSVLKTLQVPSTLRSLDVRRCKDLILPHALPTSLQTLELGGNREGILGHFPMHRMIMMVDREWFDQDTLIESKCIVLSRWSGTYMMDRIAESRLELAIARKRVMMMNFAGAIYCTRVGVLSSARMMCDDTLRRLGDMLGVD